MNFDITTLLHLLTKLNRVNVQMLFNVKEFNRFYHEGVELSRIVKIILLRLLQVQTFTNDLYGPSPTLYSSFELFLRMN